MIFVICNIIAFCITAIGCINWGLIGIFNFNLVTAIFGGASVGSTIIYILVLANIPNSKKDELYSRHLAAVNKLADVEKAKVITNDDGQASK